MEILAPASYPEYDAFLQHHPNGCYMQASNWALVKENWAHEVVVQRGPDGEIVGGMSILIRRMGPGAMLYAPRGPVCNYNDPAVIAQLLKGAAQVAKKYGGHVLKMDPYILEATGDADRDAQEEKKVQAFCRAGCTIQRNAGFKDTIQPRYNYMLPYIGGMSMEQVMAGFSSKTRNKMRHAGKHGVVCKSMGLAGLDDFYKIYSETGQRQGFHVRPKEYLAKFLTAFPAHCRLYMCYLDDVPLCGGIAVNYAGKCAHVYGCSTDARRDLRATYLLQWELMRWATETGCSVYDMQGVAVNQADSPALYGVLGFKQSFTGEIVTTVGEFEVVYRPAVAALLNLAMAARAKLRRHG